MKNTGNVSLSAVNVNDPQVPDCDRDLGSLVPDESISYTCTDPGVTSYYTNSATATGTPPSGPNVTATDTANVVITGANLLAEVELVKALDDQDYVAEVLVCVVRVYRVDTAETVPVPGGVGGFSAKVTYDPGLINILEVRGIAPFAAPVANIQNDLGETLFTQVQTVGNPQPYLCIAKLVIRLVGSHYDAAGLGVGLSLTDVETGALIPGDRRAVKSFQRADARVDGSFTLGDQLFLAQYLAGLRTLGEDYNGLHALNAASVHWDEGGDRITLQDRFLMALREVGLRDEFFNP